MSSVFAKLGENLAPPLRISASLTWMVFGRCKRHLDKLSYPPQIVSSTVGRRPDGMSISQMTEWTLLAPDGLGN